MKKSFYFILIVALLQWSCQSKEMKKAKAYMDASMYTEATSLLEIEIQDKPKNAEASYLLGLCSYNLRNFDKTEECFKRAILLESKYKTKIGTFFYDKALELVKNGNLETAERFYKQALVYDIIGKDVFASKLYSYAIAEIDISTKSEPIIKIFNFIKEITTDYNQKIAEITFSKSKTFLDRGFPEDGFKYAEFSIKNDPAHIKDLASLYLEYAQTLSKSAEKYLNAVNYFDRCLELDNSKKEQIGDIYYNISNNYIQSNNISIALFFANKANIVNEKYNKWYVELTNKYQPKQILISKFLHNYVIDARYTKDNGIQISTNDYCLRQPENNTSIRVKASGAVSSLKLHFELRNGWFKPTGVVVINDDTGQILYQVENSIDSFIDTVTISAKNASSITVKPTSSRGDYIYIYPDSEINYYNN